MAARNEVYKEINQAKNQVQDEIRRRYIADLASFTGRDTIIISSAFASAVPAKMPGNVLSITSEDIQGMMSAMHELKGDGLDLILHSPGGSLEAAEQIVSYVRKKYDDIRAIVPQAAMSAATMICCAADRIVMGKHSAIGPIDPQVTFNTGEGPFTAAAQAIIDEFEQAKNEIVTNPKTAGIWVRRLDKYPIGFLRTCQQTVDLSEEVVKGWLVKWMLSKDADGAKNAARIAKWLANSKHHKTHGRPIGIDQARKSGLVVDELEQEDAFQDKVLTLFHAAMATHEFTSCTKFIENQKGRGSYTTVQVERGN